MKPYDTKPSEYDAYEDLIEKGKDIYKRVKTPLKSSVTDKSIQEELTSFIKPKEKKKYDQDWKIYYLACRVQKPMFLKILKDAVDYLVIEKDYCGNGRPPAEFADIIKSLVIKSYHNLSSWGTETELKYAKSLGIIDRVYRKTSINKYMNSKRTAKTLHELYKIIALPIAPLETQYTIDASGISNLYKNKKWTDIRLKKHEQKTFSKLHVLSGTLTNVVGCVKITEGTKHECPFLKELIKDASKRFSIKEVSADAGYLSRENCNVISSIGATPYIMPKKGVRARGRVDPEGAWGKMIRLWKNHQMLFATHYHMRSNAESLFGMFKKRWVDYCRCKMPTTIENEILGKVVCHNAVVLIHAILSDDLKPLFMSS